LSCRSFVHDASAEDYCVSQDPFSTRGPPPLLRIVPDTTRCLRVSSAVRLLIIMCPFLLCLCVVQSTSWNRPTGRRCGPTTH
jgi:hypothetical protein